MEKKKFFEWIRWDRYWKVVAFIWVLVFIAAFTNPMSQVIVTVVVSAILILPIVLFAFYLVYHFFA